jgi:hypothetical protein
MQDYNSTPPILPSLTVLFIDDPNSLVLDTTHEERSVSYIPNYVKNVGFWGMSDQI